MHDYAPGQRWISQTEPELGIGLLIDSSERTLQLFYQAADEMRHYARANAPLKRVRFSPGDQISSRDGEALDVATVEEDATTGVLTYVGGDGRRLVESELCDTSSFDRPETRLLAGHVDPNLLFELRLAALEARHRYGLLPVRGLLGGRVDLLPHQLYIAREVTARHLPRVLLADEVGLGKTIEACLILHRLIACGLVQRVLILVPHALVHQWFVELLRRFNLSFSIFDEARCQGASDNGAMANPFLDDQFGLASIEFLTKAPLRADQAVASDWDLLVVDEAHHLHWSAQDSSPEYKLVERLSRSTPRLLLLTASPEQMGLESHFARLRLLDPHRYHSFDAYQSEHARYAAVASTIAGQLDTLSDAELADALDRHGPGRVIFRNTRARLSGFPKRCPHLIPLVLPPDTALLSRRDPRLEWLIAFLREHTDAKVLVICRTRTEVAAMVENMRTRAGIDVAHFHEQMPLIKCDRQAAWFAEPEGARLMVVSEMGGEGRNFQFASHLVLIDLPEDPELLEQRIGRLDRIGQRNDVHIHVPYLVGTREEHVVRWLHEGLNAFAQPVVGGFELRERFAGELHEVTDTVIAETHDFYEALREQIVAGRDRLLELSSFRPAIGEEVAQQITACEQSPELKAYLLRLFDHYGVHAEALDATTYHIRPDQMFCDGFPLRPEGLRITFDRDTALIHPDTTLMSWDHPMVTGAGELLLGAEHGSCAIAVDPGQTTPLQLQAIYVLETVAPPALNADRFLPPTPVSIQVDHTGALVTMAPGSQLADTDPWRLLDHARLRQELLPSMLAATRPLAEAAAQQAIEAAQQRMHATLEGEWQRLEDLRKVNDNIRPEELDHARHTIDQLATTLGAARLRLDAIRLTTAT